MSERDYSQLLAGIQRVRKNRDDAKAAAGSAPLPFGAAPPAGGANVPQQQPMPKIELKMDADD